MLTCKEFPVDCGNLYSHLRGMCWQLVLQIIVPEWLCYAKVLEAGVEERSHKQQGVQSSLISLKAAWMSLGGKRLAGWTKAKTLPPPPLLRTFQLQLLSGAWWWKLWDFRVGRHVSSFLVHLCNYLNILNRVILLSGIVWTIIRYAHSAIRSVSQ